MRRPPGCRPSSPACCSPSWSTTSPPRGCLWGTPAAWRWGMPWWRRPSSAASPFSQKQGGSVRVVDRNDTPELRAALHAAGVDGRVGGYSEADLNGRDLVVVSPGVPWDLPLVQAARRQGIGVTSEMDLFFS